MLNLSDNLILGTIQFLLLFQLPQKIYCLPQKYFKVLYTLNHFVVCEYVLRQKYLVNVIHIDHFDFVFSLPRAHSITFYNLCKLNNILVARNSCFQPLYHCLQCTINMLVATYLSNKTSFNPY